MKKLSGRLTFLAICFACCASTVTGSKLGMFSGLAPPAQRVGAVMLGQSNAADRTEIGVAMSTRPTAHFQLVDLAAGTCDAAAGAGCIADAGTAYTDANAPTWALVDLHVPIREGLQWYGNYPYNDWGGEAPGVGFALQAASEANGYTFVYDSQGVSGASLAAINVGSAAWNGMLLDVKVTKNILADAGISYVVGIGILEHGEADCQNRLYGAQLITYQAALQVALQAITGQVLPIPLEVLQQHSNCGDAGFEWSSTEELWVVETAVKTPAGINFIPAGPVYSLSVNPQSDHRTALGHQQEGELEGDQYVQYETWRQGIGPLPVPVAPASIGRTDALSGTAQDPPDAATFAKAGNCVTIQYSVPPGEVLQMDNTVYPNLHCTGPFSGWCDAGGFGLWDQVDTVDGGQPGNQFGFEKGVPVAVSGVSIDGGTMTVCGAAPWHVIEYAQSPDNGNFPDGAAYDAGSGQYCGTGPPCGKGGWLRTNYSKGEVEIDSGCTVGCTIQHWGWQFVQGGL